MATEEESSAHSQQQPEGEQEDDQQQQQPKPSTGSGLALFFRDILPPIKYATYATSLSDIPAAAIDTNGSSDEDEEDGGNNNSNDTDTAVKPMILTYKEWRETQKRLLMDFLGRRMTHETCSSDEDSSASESSSSFQEAMQEDDDDVQPETQPMFETQPLFETQDFRTSVDEEDDDDEEESSEKRPNKRRKTSRCRPKRVPHIDDTLHEVSKLEFLNLLTNTLHLPLCRVIKVWNLRDTKRGAFTPLSGVSKQCPTIANAAMPRIPFGDLEEDGPISSGFRSVLSMEVEQLYPPATGANKIAKGMRIKVFFYNIYAEKVSKWMEQQRKKKQYEYILNMTNVPADCIFPRAIDSSNWLDQHNMAEYCICIGDESSAKVVNDGIFIRFDDEELSCAMVPRTSFDAASTDDDDDDSCPEDVLLLSRSSCDDAFLSGSEGSNQMKLAADAFEPLHQEWLKYAQQFRPVTSATASPQRRENGSGSQSQSSNRDRQDPRNSENPSQDSTSAATAHPPDAEDSDEEEPFTAAPMAVVGPATPQPGGDKPREYVQLADLKSIRDKYRNEKNKMGQILNVYAVVIAFTVPSLSNRGDWKVFATLVDQTCTTPVTFTMYFKRTSPLPKLCAHGGRASNTQNKS